MASGKPAESSDGRCGVPAVSSSRFGQMWLEGMKFLESRRACVTSERYTLRASSCGNCEARLSVSVSRTLVFYRSWSLVGQLAVGREPASGRTFCLIL